MRTTRKALAQAIALSTGAALAFCGQASAFPTFSDCPRSSGVNTCIDIQSREGLLRIRDFDVPLGPSLEIRGGVILGSPSRFVPATGTNGFFAEPVAVPGGLLGIDFPGPFDDVYATAELAGTANDINIDMRTFAISLPLKLHLEHPLLGWNCRIGSNSNPVSLNLQNTRLGTPTRGNPGTILQGGVNADSTFSIPGASGCLFGLGLVNGVINLKLGLPSPSGENSITTTSDIAIAAPSQIP